MLDSFPCRIASAPSLFTQRVVKKIIALLYTAHTHYYTHQKKRDEILSMTLPVIQVYSLRNLLSDGPILCMGNCANLGVALSKELDPVVKHLDLMCWRCVNQSQPSRFSQGSPSVKIIIRSLPTSSSFSSLTSGTQSSSFSELLARAYFPKEWNQVED
jgi:hypothetical protein